MIRIECTEFEKDTILLALEDWCPFEPETIKECNEDSDCEYCFEKNIEFIVGEEIKERENE